MERIRVKFSRGSQVKFLSHLDLMRLWERAFRRAGFPLVYSEGFTPHPRLSLAVPLQVGVTSDAELMDVFLSSWLSPSDFIAGIKKQLPEGIGLEGTKLVPEESPSLQSQALFAEYLVEVKSDKIVEEIQTVVRSLLEQKTIPWQHPQKEGDRHYDLRPLIDEIWLVSCIDQNCTLGMRLRCDQNGTGRPEQVTKALGFTDLPRSIHRTNLVFLQPAF
jgi:radical SAM-linked protein